MDIVSIWSPASTTLPENHSIVVGPKTIQSFLDRGLTFKQVAALLLEIDKAKDEGRIRKDAFTS